MTKKILVVQNIAREGPGLLGDEIKSRGASFDVLAAVELGAFRRLDDYGAVIILGGPSSADDKTAPMTDEIDFIREVLAVGMPYLGVCLGMQALVAAAGGRIVKSPVKETGFRGPDGDYFNILTTAAGRRGRLFDGLGAVLKVFQLHGETAELPDGATLLAAGKFCFNQAVKVGPSAYGIQGHFELTRRMLETWLAEDPELAALDKGHLREDFEAIENEYTRDGRRLFGNFLGLSGF